MAPPMADEGAALSVKVKKVQLGKAIRALKQLVAKRSANTNPLFGASTETMQLQFTLSSIPDKRKLKPVMIPLPHPMFDDKSEVCFVAKDPQKEYKELLLRKHPVPGLTKVIGIDKLRRNYKTGEQKRALADAFDLFLCDSRVVEMMPKLLGSVFYNKKLKRPIPVKLKPNEPEANLRKAIGGTPFRVPAGPCVGVKFGRCSMTEEELAENAASVIASILRHVSANPLQSISVQATDSPALPVWRRPRPPGGLLDLKKYHSSAASSAASDTGMSGASETELTLDSSEIPSDAGESLRTRDTVSELETGGETMSELESVGETPSELDIEAGDVEESPLLGRRHLPLLQGIGQKKKRRMGGTQHEEAMEVVQEPLAKRPRKGKVKGGSQS